MIKFKKTSAIAILLAALMVLSTSIFFYAQDFSALEELITQEPMALGEGPLPAYVDKGVYINEHNGFILTWRWHDFGHIGLYMLERVEGNGIVAIYEYDQFGNRTSKNVNGQVTRFYYEEFYGRFYLMREVSCYAVLDFVYEIFQGRAGTPFKILAGVSINGVLFEYYMQYDTIIGLIDPHGTLVAKYTYEHDGPFINMVSAYILLDDSFVNVDHVDVSYHLYNLLVRDFSQDSINLSQNCYAILASLSNIEFNGYADRETGWTMSGSGDFLDRETNTFIPRPHRSIT